MTKTRRNKIAKCDQQFVALQPDPGFPHMVESPHMTKIPGRLIVDLLPDGTMRTVFLATSGDKDASPNKAKDIDAAEFLFLNCGLSVERAAALRAEVTRSKVAAMDTVVDEEIAIKFRYIFPSK
jgi:hypothetical protein